jgi:hypothetical protein
MTAHGGIVAFRWLSIENPAVVAAWIIPRHSEDRFCLVLSAEPPRHHRGTLDAPVPLMAQELCQIERRVEWLQMRAS